MLSEVTLGMAYRRLPVGVFRHRFGQVAVVVDITEQDKIRFIEMEWPDGQRSMMRGTRFADCFEEWDGR